MIKEISSNVNYVMNVSEGKLLDSSFLKINSLKTIFLHDGEMTVDLKLSNKTKSFQLLKDQGIIIAPWVEFEISKCDCFFVSVQSEENNKPIIEIVDNNSKRSEIDLVDFRLIDKPKKVVKPWGHEIWICWFKNHHVLKKIFMTKGNKCSLQYHEMKSETNFIVSGKANVLNSIYLENGVSQGEALKEYNKLDNIQSYIRPMGHGDHWDNVPYEIHRVFSVESYTAYEASTAELDDVIRLQDDNNRVSGFIASEHSY